MPAKKKREEESEKKTSTTTTTTTTTKNQQREEKKKTLPTNYHLKKSLKKKLEILAKYERLKETGPGKLEKELAKRRKKASQRGQKFMPRTRR